MDDANAIANAFEREEQEFHDRRKHQRHLGKATVTIHRDRDLVRVGFRATLDNISITGVRIVTPMPLDEGEHIKITLQNEVQRFTKEYRGIVCWKLQMPDQNYRIGIELLAQITSLDLMAFKRAGLEDAPGTEKFWL